MSFLPLLVCDIFSYTLLPIQGKTTRPGAQDRNYDLDARCVFCAAPRNPGAGHQPPCPMPPCTVRAALPVPAANAQQGVGGTPVGRRLQACPLRVRASSLGRMHLLNSRSSACSSRALPCHCHCHCRVWGLFMIGMLRCQARTHWGRDEAAGSDDLFAASWLPIYLLFLERPVAVRETLLNVRGVFVVTLPAYVVPDLPCLAAGVIALSLLKVRPCSGRSSSSKDAVLAGRSFLGLLACWLGSRGCARIREQMGRIPFPFPSLRLTNPFCGEPRCWTNSDPCPSSCAAGLGFSFRLRGGSSGNSRSLSRIEPWQTGFTAPRCLLFQSWAFISPEP